MPEFKDWKQIGSLLKEVDTPYKLLGLVAILACISLGAVATQLTGTSQILAVAMAFAVLAATLVAAVSVVKSLASRGGPPDAQVEPVYDAFISAPMDAICAQSGAKAMTDKMRDITKALHTECKLKNTYFAGQDIDNPQGYQSPHIALRENFDALKKSKRFVMIYPEKLSSSILVEAGMALAMGKPSFWFVQAGATLPYLLREATNASGEKGLPKIERFTYQDLDGVLQKISTDKSDLFGYS